MCNQWSSPLSTLLPRWLKTVSLCLSLPCFFVSRSLTSSGGNPGRRLPVCLCVDWPVAVRSDAGDSLSLSVTGALARLSHPHGARHSLETDRCLQLTARFRKGTKTRLDVYLWQRHVQLFSYLWNNISSANFYICQDSQSHLGYIIGRSAKSKQTRLALDSWTCFPSHPKTRRPTKCC